MKYLLIVTLAFLGACQPPQETVASQSLEVGYDRWGISDACLVDAEICPALGWDEDVDLAFQASCREAGYEVVNCSCGPALCNGEMKTGPDMNGIDRTCAVSPDPSFSCTADFQPGDQYALDCEASGGTPIACGCHDYICFGAPQP